LLGVSAPLVRADGGLMKAPGGPKAPVGARASRDPVDPATCHGGSGGSHAGSQGPLGPPVQLGRLTERRPAPVKVAIVLNDSRSGNRENPTRVYPVCPASPQIHQTAAATQSRRAIPSPCGRVPPPRGHHKGRQGRKAASGNKLPRCTAASWPFGFPDRDTNDVASCGLSADSSRLRV
jgi:hypothetical protein